MARVLAVTTSMGSKWEAYSQALLALEVPEWRRVVVDGRRDWTATMFLEHVVDADVDYIVHVDEDCFVRSRAALLELVARMEAEPALVAAGIPDGGYYYREHNPAALNLFFVLFRASALRAAWARRGDWTALKFDPAFAEDVRAQRPELDPERVLWEEGEPYYPLFWSLLGAGGRFLYLRDRLNRRRWSSEVLAPGGEVLVEHLWYLRIWMLDDVMPGHDRPNVERYREAEAEMRARYRGSPRFWLVLGWMHLRRLLRRLA